MLRDHHPRLFQLHHGGGGGCYCRARAGARAASRSGSRRRLSACRTRPVHVHRLRARERDDQRRGRRGHRRRPPAAHQRDQLGVRPRLLPGAAALQGPRHGRADLLLHHLRRRHPAAVPGRARPRARLRARAVRGRPGSSRRGEVSRPVQHVGQRRQRDHERGRRRRARHGDGRGVRRHQQQPRRGRRPQP